ncbi:hypothetical protein [Lentibacillus sp. CBA3610]|nr:hypothetical protein [Lentibacillus sp. CBA3610]
MRETKHGRELRNMGQKMKTWAVESKYGRENWNMGRKSEIWAGNS